MQTSNNVIHVNENDFQVEVLTYSSQRPVVVDFWAEWCVPCKTLDPILEKLAQEAGGAFRLAKLDVDTNAKLALNYGVRGIPTVKAFRNGQVVAEFSGLRPEPQVREFLNALGSVPNDIAIGKGNHLMHIGEWKNAEDVFRKQLDEYPDHSGALLGLAKSVLAQGRPADALPILREFPISKEYLQAEQLLPLAQSMADQDLEILSNQDEQDALYSNALRLVGKGQIAAALDGLLDLLRADKNYRKGELRNVILGLFLLLHDEEARQYRAELASLVF